MYLKSCDINEYLFNLNKTQIKHVNVFFYFTSVSKWWLFTSNNGCS